MSLVTSSKKITLKYTEEEMRRKSKWNITKNQLNTKEGSDKRIKKH